eukprot:7835057-Pyramimonas_sp.AAC.1
MLPMRRVLTTSTSAAVSAAVSAANVCLLYCWGELRCTVMGELRCTVMGELRCTVMGELRCTVVGELRRPKASPPTTDRESRCAVVGELRCTVVGELRCTVSSHCGARCGAVWCYAVLRGAIYAVGREYVQR